MQSLQSQVTEIVINDENLTVNDVIKLFPDRPSNSIKSAYRRAKKRAEKVHLSALSGSKITMANMESLLVKQLEKKADTATLRLMVEFLKIKQQDQSELQEIDLTKFYKTAMEK